MAMANLRTLNRMFLNGLLCSFDTLWRRAMALLVAIAIGLISYSAAPPPLHAASMTGGSMTEASTMEAPAPALDDSADVPSEQIDHFAQAYLQVLQLLSDREPELPAAETSAEAQKIQQSIEADAIKIIERNGLSLPEYMNILGLASQDESFQDKVLGRMDESVEDASKG